jgi:hypothetical protein
VDPLMFENLSEESQKILDYLALSAAISAAETAANELDEAPFDDDDVRTLAGLPDELRLPVLTRLVGVAEVLREGARTVDAVILVASGGQAITTA